MVEPGDGPAFPVVYFDGEIETDVGTVVIYPKLEFKAFQLMLSQKIKVSPNQISIYLCHRMISNFEDRRRVAITSKVDFTSIAREKDCFFLVVAKRSRKSRNRKAKLRLFTENEFPAPDNLILLRRNQQQLYNDSSRRFDFGYPFYDQISRTELFTQNDRLENLKIQRENYAMAMAQSNRNLIHLNSPSPSPHPNPNPNLNPNSFPRIQDTLPTMKKKTVCEFCAGTKKNGKTTAFHHCVNDPVYVGAFRSGSGPVCRPVHSSM